MGNQSPAAIYLSFYSSLFKSICALVFARLYPSQTPPPRNLSGQTAIVTGANSGIGLSIATALARQGATVYLACRSTERGSAAVTEVVAKAGADSRTRVFCWKLDVGDLQSVRAFCERWRSEGKPIDMLVHNAGIAGPPAGAAKTKDGLGVIYTTNFLGSFLMTNLLECNLSPAARVVCTSSTGHYSAVATLFPPPTPTAQPGTAAALALKSDSVAYGHSKAQQVLFVQLLQRHFSSLPDNRRTAHVFTPGFTSTPIFGKMNPGWETWLSDPLFAMLRITEKWFAVDTDEGAKTGVWLASGAQVEGGRFWEWMTLRTSAVDLLRGRMGEAQFRRAARGEWTSWEKDSGVGWEVEI